MHTSPGLIVRLQCLHSLVIASIYETLSAYRLLGAQAPASCASWHVSRSCFMLLFTDTYYILYSTRVTN